MDSAPAQAPQPVEPLSAAPLVLQYDSGAPPRRRFLELTLFIPATVAGAVATFLPFTYDVAPFGVVLQTGEVLPDVDHTAALLLLLAWTFLVPVLLLPLRLRVLLVGPSSRLERRVAYVIAGLATAAVVTCLGIMIPRVSLRDEYAIVGAGVASLAAGAFLFARVARRGGDVDRAVFTAMLAPYVANSAIVLVGFAADRDAGWYVTLAAAGAGLAEMILLAAGSRTRPST